MTDVGCLSMNGPNYQEMVSDSSGYYLRCEWIYVDDIDPLSYYS